MVRFADEYERVDGFIESALDLTTYDLAGEDDVEKFVEAAFSSFVFEMEIKVCALSKATLCLKNLLLRASILYCYFN